MREAGGQRGRAVRRAAVLPSRPRCRRGLPVWPGPQSLTNRHGSARRSAPIAAARSQPAALPLTPCCLPARPQIRPPVEHQWGCGTQLVHGAPPAPVSLFRHRLLQLFQLSVFCKLPIRPMTTMHDLRWAGLGGMGGLGAWGLGWAAGPLGACC